MSIKSIIRNCLLNRIKRKLSAKACFDDIRTNRLNMVATISLFGTSSKEDIRIGRNAFLYGDLVSSDGGKIEIGRFAQVGTHTCVRSVLSVTIGDFTAIANNVIIQDNNSHPVNPNDRIVLRQTPHLSKERGWLKSDFAPVVIGRNCWVGENSRICKGVTIGDGSIVAANAVVTKSVPPNCIVAGNPAKIVKTDIDKLPRVFNDADYPDFERYTSSDHQEFTPINGGGG